MINIYDDNVDGDKVKVFISIKNNIITGITIGNHVVPKKSGIQFYVDGYVAPQLNKTSFSMEGLQPKLTLKDGETIDTPEKSSKEIEIEKLKNRLEELQNAE